MCEVTVVIPNYNGEAFLLPCLEALYCNTKIKIAVLIVDNGSDDQSVKKAQAVYPQADYILLDQNYGFCRAVNEGIRRCHTPYVILLNNDTKICPGFVEHLLACIKRSDRIFSVEAKMLQDQNRTRIDSGGTFYNALGWAFARGKDEPSGQYDRRELVFAACAGAAIYRKRIIEQIGYFDERHFAYLEDIDIGYRARLSGYVNVYEPKAVVFHVGSGASGSRYNAFKIKYSSRNNIYMIYKNMPFVQILLNLPLLLAGFSFKFLFFCKKGFGSEYGKGLLQGLRMCRREDRFHVRKGQAFQYVRVQIELWINVIRRFLK